MGKICIPTCSFEDDCRTLSFNAAEGPDFTFATLLQPCPGTEICRFCEENGYLGRGTEARQTPDSFFHGSVLELPDKKRRVRLRSLFALSVEFPLVRRCAAFLSALPLGRLCTLLDKL